MTHHQRPEAEKRSFVAPVQHRADDAGKVTVAGYAAVFNQEADIGGYFRERLSPGAFAQTLKDADVRAYFDHDSGRVLGRSGSGTLRLREDDHGLAVEIDLPDTSDGRDVAELIARGDVSGMSFGFMVRKQEWDETQDPPLRTITDVDLVEVSIVSIPAYDGTSVALRSLDAVRNETKRRNFDAMKLRHAMKREIDRRARGI